MASRTQKPVIEMKVPGGGGLVIAVAEDNGHHEARLNLPGLHGVGPCIGIGLSPRTCLRDAKTFLQAALTRVDEELETEA